MDQALSLPHDSPLNKQPPAAYSTRDMSRIDLHLHTTHSDGSLSPTEVLRLAHKAGVTALAITDHDIVSGIPEAIAAGAELGIEIIPGVEISSCVGNSELHILGYCVHWQDSELNQRLAALRESRHSRNPQIIERLRSLGLDVTYEEVRALAGTDSIGRPHPCRPKPVPLHRSRPAPMSAAVR